MNNKVAICFKVGTIYLGVLVLLLSKFVQMKFYLICWYYLLFHLP